MIPKNTDILTAFAGRMHLLTEARFEARRAGITIDEYIASHPDQDARRVLKVLLEMYETRKAKEAVKEAQREKEQNAFEIATRDETIARQVERIAELERTINRIMEAKMREDFDRRKRHDRGES